VGVSARERQHVDTILRAVEASATEALALVCTHVSEYPRDALPLSMALGVFGLLGFSGRLDHHEAQLALLEELAPYWGDDWWFLGYLGWTYIETGEVAAGTRLVERSLAGNPRNAHAAHQRVHGFFEAGDTAGGADFIQAWLSDYDRAGHLHCHLSWHLALFELSRGDAERARAIYLDSIRPSVAQSAPMLSLADSASFLWRWRLYGAAPSLDSNGARSPHTRAGISLTPVSPSPICMRPLPKQRPAMTNSCRGGSAGCIASPRTAASRRAMLRPRCAPAPLPSPAAKAARPCGCSKRRSPTCPELAEATRNARSSRTR
jgi:hypothetical protein